MAGHTPEPWIYEQYADFSETDSAIVAENGSGIVIAQIWGVDVEAINCPTAKANAERIVACVNACKGINPEAVPLMLEALRQIVMDVETWESNPSEPEWEAITMAQDAIAKATEPQQPPVPSA